MQLSMTLVCVFVREDSSNVVPTHEEMPFILKSSPLNPNNKPHLASLSSRCLWSTCWKRCGCSACCGCSRRWIATHSTARWSSPCWCPCSPCWPTGWPASGTSSARWRWRPTPTTGISVSAGSGMPSVALKSQTTLQFPCCSWWRHSFSAHWGCYWALDQMQGAHLQLGSVLLRDLNMIKVCVYFPQA